MLTLLSTNQPIPDVLLDGLAPDLTTISVMIRLGIAAGLGALIGLERKMADKPADGRTMMLICAGAAAFVLLGLQIAADAGPSEITRIDSTRVLSYIISGIGFLGAGAILHSKKAVIGLTTAAAIWVAAAIGAACGLGKFDTALMMFGIVIVALWAPWVLHMNRDDGDANDGDDAPDNSEPELPISNTDKGGKSDKNGKGDKSPREEKSGKNNAGKGDKNGKSGKNGKDDR